MSALPRLLRFGGLNVAHGVVTALAAALTAGLLYRRLGVDFGILALVTGGMLRLNLVDDSLGTYVVTAIAGGEAAAARRLAMAAQLYLVLAVGFATVFGLGVALLLHARPDVATLACLAALGLLLATLCNLLSKVLEGNEEYLALRLAQSSLALLRLATVAALFIAGVEALEPYVLLYVVSYAALGALLAVLVRSRGGVALPAGWWRRRPAAEERGEVGRFLRPLLVAKGASIVSYRLDLWVVQALVGSAATAAYAMAEALAGLAAQSLEVLKALLPVSVRDWRRDAAWVRRLALGSTKISLLLVGGLCAVGIATAEPVLRLWFGEVPATALTAARLLLLFYALTSFRSTLQILLAGQGMFDRFERQFLIAAGLNAGLSLAATWAFGGWGAALGTVLSGVYLLVANLRAAERALRLEPALLARRVVAPGLVCLGLAAAVAAWPAGPSLASAPLLDLVLRGALSAVVFLAGFWFLVLTPAERQLRPGAALRRSP